MKNNLITPDISYYVTTGMIFLRNSTIIHANEIIILLTKGLEMKFLLPCGEIHDVFQSTSYLNEQVWPFLKRTHYEML